MNELGELGRQSVWARIKGAVGWVWTVAGWLGAPQLAASFLIAAGSWAYGYLRKEPVVTLSMSAVSLFVALAYLSRLPVIARWMSSKPKARIWRHADTLALWHAACLLADIEPPAAMTGWLPTSDANAYYAVLALAVSAGELERVHMPGQQAMMDSNQPEPINFGTFVTRASLQNFARKRQFKAAFLE